VTDRGARRVLAGVSGVLVAAALLLDFPERSGGHFWSDGASYYSMAWSLARDLDTRYQPRDVERVLREFPLGPRGVFLKRASGGLTWAPERGFPWLHRVPPEQPRLYFAKSIVYPALAAPLVALFGTPGLLLTNALAMAAALFLGYALARRRHGPGGALAWSLLLLLGSATAVYLVWPQPEIVNVGLITAGLWAWASGRWPSGSARCSSGPAPPRPRRGPRGRGPRPTGLPCPTSTAPAASPRSRTCSPGRRASPPPGST